MSWDLLINLKQIDPVVLKHERNCDQEDCPSKWREGTNVPLRLRFARGPMVKQLVNGTPLGRLGQPEDMVGPVVFLASSDAHWVTGEVLFASGGSR
jgi:NAD(P)-dependent dehydrogenase (short-subunit alcohol dehydrogenase family)